MAHGPGVYAALLLEEVSEAGLRVSGVSGYSGGVLPDIKSLLKSELEGQLGCWGEPAYRAGQVLQWLYGQRVTDWGQMKNLPANLRAQLQETYSLSTLALVRKEGSQDTTQKFLWRLHDGNLVESVLIPANPALYGDASDRHTLCVSTQVGCAYGCRFCASGLDGWKRNLGAEEIIEQVLAVERWAKSGAADAPAASKDGRLINNLVIMGMGEPLANYANLIKGLNALNAPWGGGLGARKITVSTSGLAPQICQLADEPHQFRLAISLHGARDEVRNQIMPVNKKYPLSRLVEACEYYQSKKGRMITFEYILIAGINDGLDETKPLAQLALRLHAKVNLIPYNTVEGLPWTRPALEVQEAFQGRLIHAGVAATLRREKGHDIAAACGQLRLKTEKEEKSSCT